MHDDTVPATIAPAGEPHALRHLDATLTNLRAAERSVASMVTFMTEARDRLAASPDDAEARHAVRFAEIRMRSAAFTMAQNLAALSQPDWVTP